MGHKRMPGLTLRGNVWHIKKKLTDSGFMKVLEQAALNKLRNT
jgi:hypothetical protein